MAVRPFYIESRIEGRKYPLNGGPKRKEGVMNTDIMQRDKGDIKHPFHISQYSTFDEDGKQYLHTDIYFNGELLKEHVTEY